MPRITMLNSNASYMCFNKCSPDSASYRFDNVNCFPLFINKGKGNMLWLIPVINIVKIKHSDNVVLLSDSEMPLNNSVTISTPLCVQCCLICMEECIIMINEALIEHNLITGQWANNSISVNWILIQERRYIFLILLFRTWSSPNFFLPWHILFTMPIIHILMQYLFSIYEI